jgi:hypothetical protein
LAIVIDALHGFRELLHTVSDFQFAISPFIERRFYALCENVDTIFACADDSSLLWHHAKTGRFLHDAVPIHLLACPAIVNESKTHVVHFSSNLVTSYDDRLMAITSALVIGDSIHDLDDMHIFIVNVTNGSVEMVKLLSDSHQPIVEDATVQNPELLRRTPCAFLEAAVRYKSIPRGEDKPLIERCVVPGQTVSLQEEEDEDSDAVFVSKAHEVIDRILAKKRNANPFGRSPAICSSMTDVDDSVDGDDAADDFGDGE